MTNPHDRWLYGILASYLILAALYSIMTPIFEASDELWHYPMVKYMADNGLRLPPQDPAQAAAWRQEGSQPPLYYMMAAILTAWIDTSDMDSVRRINPHADIGVVRPDGNANMIAHRMEAEAFPWRGTTLAVHIVRFFSIMLGLGTVVVTYLLARVLFPDEPLVALGAAALNAFLPMFLFISGSVNNDNLSNLLGNLLTLLVVRLLNMRQLPTWRAYAFLGICTGAGLLAKLNLGFFIPVIAFSLAVLSIRLRNWRPLLIGGFISGALTIAIAGWWYWHNWQTYGDPTGLNMFLQMVGRRAIPANLAQLWSERHSFTQAYWGFFGGVNVPLPELQYLILNLIGGCGLLSAFGFMVRVLIRGKWSSERLLPASITVIWPLVTFISYLRWTAETPASQGRLIFVALSSLSLWMAVGWTWWLPKRVQSYVLTGITGLFVLIALLTPFTVIAPAYAQPPEAASAPTITTFEEPTSNPSGAVALTHISIKTPQATPEAYVHVQTRWQIDRPFSADWSLFVHLVTPDGVIVSQRDIYPGQGSLALSDLAQGRRWDNDIAIAVPTAAYAPMQLDVMIGWYNLQTGERLKLADQQETYLLGQIALKPRQSDDTTTVPNPITVNFDNQIELVGYALTDLSPDAGATIELTLYWRGIQQLDRDYKVFANVLDPQTLTKYAASDGMPVNWQAPTTTWAVGTVIKDTHTLTIDPTAPPGIYETEVGLYWQTDDGSLQRLRIVTRDGGMANDYLNLTRVRILPAGNS